MPLYPEPIQPDDRVVLRGEAIFHGKIQDGATATVIRTERGTGYIHVKWDNPAFHNVGADGGWYESRFQKIGAIDAPMDDARPYLEAVTT